MVCMNRLLKVTLHSLKRNGLLILYIFSWLIGTGVNVRTSHLEPGKLESTWRIIPLTGSKCLITMVSLVSPLSGATFPFQPCRFMAYKWGLPSYSLIGMILQLTAVTPNNSRTMFHNIGGLYHPHLWGWFHKP